MNVYRTNILPIYGSFMLHTWLIMVESSGKWDVYGIYSGFLMGLHGGLIGSMAGIYGIVLPSGKRLHNYGKIHHIS